MLSNRRGRGVRIMHHHHILLILLLLIHCLFRPQDPWHNSNLGKVSSDSKIYILLFLGLNHYLWICLYFFKAWNSKVSDSNSAIPSSDNVGANVNNYKDKDKNKDTIIFSPPTILYPWTSWIQIQQILRIWGRGSVIIITIIIVVTPLKIMK